MFQITPEYRKEYRAKNWTKVSLYAHDYKLKNPEKYLFWTAKTRARKRDLEFTIQFEDIVIPKFCPVLGIELVFDPGRLGHEGRNGGGAPSPNAPSVDRIDPTKGYIPGNVRVISWRANSLKKDASRQELIALAADAIRNR